MYVKRRRVSGRDAVTKLNHTILETFVKKGGDEIAAAHLPDILARLLSETAHKWRDCTAHKFHPGRGIGWWRDVSHSRSPSGRAM
jgi:hypothetical protein